MNQYYTKIKSLLKGFERYKSNYEKGLKKTDEELNIILRELPDDDPIKRGLIGYIHNFEGIFLDLVRSQSLNDEPYLREGLLKLMEDKKC